MLTWGHDAGTSASQEITLHAQPGVRHFKCDQRAVRFGVVALRSGTHASTLVFHNPGQVETAWRVDNVPAFITVEPESGVVPPDDGMCMLTLRLLPTQVAAYTDTLTVRGTAVFA